MPHRTRHGSTAIERRACLALLLVACTPPGSAFADVRPPVEFQLAGPPRAAHSGRRYCGTLLVSAHQRAHLDSLRLAGEGWRIERFTPPSRRWLSPGKPLRIPFRAIPSDAAAPLIVLAGVGGATMEKWLDLSPDAIQRATRTGGVRPVPKRRRRRRPYSFRVHPEKRPLTPEVPSCAAIP